MKSLGELGVEVSVGEGVPLSGIFEQRNGWEILTKPSTLGKVAHWVYDDEWLLDCFNHSDALTPLDIPGGSPSMAYLLN